MIRPLPDEPFDSWVELMASAHGATVREMADGLGLVELNPHAKTGTTTSLRTWATQLPEEQLGRLVEASGLPINDLRAMTRMHFAASAIRLTRSGRISSFCPSTGVAGRYCPECLEDSGGRWRLSWQFPFGFACLRHGRVLVDRCPGCDQPPRQIDHPSGVVPTPGFCHNRVREGSQASRRCGHDLSSGAAAFAAPPIVLEAQRAMLRVVSSGRGSFGIYAADPQPAIRVLDDMALLSRVARAAVHADPVLGVTILGRELFSRYEELAGLERRRPELRPTDATLVAVGNALARSFLESAERAGELLHGRISPNTPYSLYSTQLQALVATTLGRRRRPTGVMQTALLGVSDPATRATKLPSVLWEPWVAALAPRRVDKEIAGGALAAAVVLAGTRLTHGAALSLLDPAAPGRRVTHVMRELGRTPTEPHTLLALSRLAEYLDRTDTPIDYQRRRQLDYMPLLPRQEWNSVCANANVSAGGAKRWLLARLYAYSMLSGSRVATAPFATEALTHRSVERFHASAPPQIHQEIERICRQFLHHHGIDEPAIWHPPLEFAVLPGADDEGEGVAGHVWPEARPAVARMSRRMPVQKVAIAYAGGQSLREVASATGVARQTVRRALTAAGVQPRNPGRNSVPIDVNWLRRRYQVDRLTMREIAAEVGCHTMTISRHLERAGIETRPRGSASRATALRPDPRAGDSTLLRAVLIGQGSVERARRFLIVTRYKSISAAADQLGIADSVLGTQMKRLSQDAGGALMLHAGGNRPLRVTPLGRRLAKDLRDRFAEQA